jgi:hypothetical protein
MKDVYESPVMEVIQFACEDVITESGKYDAGNNENSGELWDGT